MDTAKVPLNLLASSITQMVSLVGIQTLQIVLFSDTSTCYSDLYILLFDAWWAYSLFQGHSEYAYQQSSYGEQSYDRTFDDSSQHYYEGGQKNNKKKNPVYLWLLIIILYKVVEEKGQTP